MDKLITVSDLGFTVRLNARGEQVSLSPQQVFSYQPATGVTVRLIGGSSEVRCELFCEGNSRAPSISHDWVISHHEEGECSAGTVEQLVSSYQVALNGRW